MLPNRDSQRKFLSLFSSRANEIRLNYCEFLFDSSSKILLIAGIHVCEKINTLIRYRSHIRYYNYIGKTILFSIVPLRKLHRSPSFHWRFYRYVIYIIALIRFNAPICEFAINLGHQ